MGTPMLPTLDSSRGLLPENNINSGSPWPVSVIFRFASKRIVRNASFPSNQVAQDPPQRKLNFLGRLSLKKFDHVNELVIGGAQPHSHRLELNWSWRNFVISWGWSDDQFQAVFCLLPSKLSGTAKNSSNFILDSRVDPCWSLPFFVQESRNFFKPRLHSPGYSAIRL